MNEVGQLPILPMVSTLLSYLLKNNVQFTNLDISKWLI